MQTVHANQVVGIIYTVTDETGQELESNRGREPLRYLHGHGQLVGGVERALEGRHEGDTVEVNVPPHEGYGHVDPSRRFTVPRSQFDFDVTAGDLVQAQLPSGQLVPLQVTEASLEVVTLDGNHPLAGKTLTFEVEVIDIRPATSDELIHGHAHGSGGHLHH